jgi:cytochrome c553
MDASGKFTARRFADFYRIRMVRLFSTLATALSLSLVAASLERADAQTAHRAQTPSPATKAHDPLPEWAYPVPARGAAEPPPQETFVARALPGTDVTLFVSQTNERFNVGDWRPGEHPAMPNIVAHGRAPDVIACAFCHYPNGLGRPENSSIAGLPLDYIIAQVTDMKAGVRSSAEPKMGPPAAMRKLAAVTPPTDLGIAAAYFAKLKPKKWIRIVETDTVPKVRVGGGSLFVPVEGGGVEPIGDRIVETAEDLGRAGLRDPASGFVAYVPRGSVAKGRRYVTTGGGGRAKPCAQCHGTDLRGVGVVPRIAGRSPSYITRQLYDIQSGARHGAGAAPMNDVVASLTNDDMLAISAYLATLAP